MIVYPATSGLEDSTSLMLFPGRTERSPADSAAKRPGQSENERNFSVALSQIVEACDNDCIAVRGGPLATANPPGWRTAVALPGSTLCWVHRGDATDVIISLMSARFGGPAYPPINKGTYSVSCLYEMRTGSDQAAALQFLADTVDRSLPPGWRSGPTEIEAKGVDFACPDGVEGPHITVWSSELSPGKVWVSIVSPVPGAMNFTADMRKLRPEATQEGVR